MSRNDDRNRRLAEALRANLRRRKDQQRGADPAGRPPGEDNEPDSPVEELP